MIRFPGFSHPVDFFLFCCRIAHSISEGGIPIERMRFDLADLVIASLRDTRHRPLASNFAAILHALEIYSSPSKAKGSSREGKKDRRINQVHRRVLLQLLVAAVEQEVGSMSGSAGEAPESEIVDPDLTAGRRVDNVHSVFPASGGGNKKKVKGSSSSRRDLTIILLRALPGLMSSYKTELPVLRSLTRLPQHFGKLSCFYLIV